MTRPVLLLVAVVLAVLVALPPFLSFGWQNALVTMLIASLFAAAFNLLVGQGGMLSFGHAAYYGVGAFATLHLMRAVEAGFAFPTVLLPLAGGLAGLVVGAVAGWFATIRSGVYFALITLAIAEMLHSLAPHLAGTFGGEAGMSSMRMPWAGFMFGQIIEVYYLTLAWVVVCLALLWGYTRTPFGRITLGIRENEQRLRFLGYDLHKSKVVVFMISSTFSGIAGGLLAVSNEVANYTMFSTHISAQVVLHTFIGGSTLFLGPVVGASVLTVFAYVVSDLTRSWLLYQGVLFVLVMLFVPRGLAGLAELHWRHGRELRTGDLALPYTTGLLAGLLILAGAVFVIESLEVLFSPHYTAMAARVEGLPPFTKFGFDWAPLSPLTWAVPAALFAAGGFLLMQARRLTVPVWERVQSEEPAEQPA